MALDGLDGLDGLAAFIRVADMRSFTAAAASFGLSPSAMSNAIRQLETKLDVRLFNRTTRSVSLTEAGVDLLNRIGPIMAELQSEIGQVSNSASKPAGVLRLNVPRSASVAFIEPVLREFLDAYPDISLEVVIDNGLTDIVSQGFDAGIRFGDVLEKDMLVIPVRPEMQVAIVASPEYLARKGIPRHPSALHDHHCINLRTLTSGTLYRWHLEKEGERMDVAVEGRLVTNDSILALQAALDGVGLAYLFDDYVQRFLDSGHLVRVLKEWSPREGLFLYYYNRRSMPPKLRVFIDFLKEVNQRPSLLREKTVVPYLSPLAPVSGAVKPKGRAKGSKGTGT